MNKDKTTWKVMQEDIERQKNKPALSKVKDYLSEKYQQLKPISESEYELGKTVKDRWENFKQLMAIKKAERTAKQKKAGEGDKDARSKDITRTKNKSLKDFQRGAGFFKEKDEEEEDL